MQLSTWDDWLAGSVEVVVLVVAGLDPGSELEYIDVIAGSLG